MKSLRLECGACSASLTIPLSSVSAPTVCPVCQTTTLLEVFPALFRDTPRGRDGEAILIEGESSCFYHAAKKAAVACAQCGRFLCALCDIEMNGQHLCPTCLESGVAKKRIAPLRSETLYYDDMALNLAIYPIVFVWATLLTAPIAIFVSLWYWRKPQGILPRSRWRFIAAILIALAELGLWAALAILILGRGKT